MTSGSFHAKPESRTKNKKVETVNHSLLASVVEKLLENDQNNLNNNTPRSISIDSNRLNLHDIKDDIDRFREQNVFLSTYGTDSWPCVSLFKPASDEEMVSMPIDLFPSAIGWQISLEEKVRRAEDTLQTIEASNVTIEFVTRDRVAKTFSDWVGHVLFKRFFSEDGTQVRPGDDDVPRSSVTIATTSHGRELVYCRGYFFSTGKHFGVSSPAKRQIPYGTYAIADATQGLNFNVNLVDVFEPNIQLTWNL